MVLVERGEIESAVLQMLRINMGLKAQEQLLVVSDVPTLAQWSVRDLAFLTTMVKRTILARTVAEIARDCIPEVEVRFLPFPSTGRNAVEPPEEVAAAMKVADIVIIITSFSLSHTDAREEACRAGARIASMPRFLPEMFQRGGPMDVDYAKIRALTERIAGLLTAAQHVHVTCPVGTNIRFRIAERPGKVDAGLYTHTGEWGNLPAGEAYCAPVEGTAQGVIQVTPRWYPGLSEPMSLVIDRGELVELHGGGGVGDELRELLRPGDQNEPYRSRRNLGEFGVGTNPNASRVDTTLEAEKIRGTVHLALGDNAHMGGQVSADYHQDFVIPHASFALDDRWVMRDAEFQIPAE